MINEVKLFIDILIASDRVDILKESVSRQMTKHLLVNILPKGI